MAQGTEVLAWVDGDVRLKRVAFAAAGTSAPNSATVPASVPQGTPQSPN